MKEKIKDLIWKCFECRLSPDGEFKRYKVEGKDSYVRFFNYEDIEVNLGYRDTFSWGVMLYLEDDYYCFPVFDYFNGTPIDLYKRFNQIVDEMAADIAEFVDGE